MLRLQCILLHHFKCFQDKLLCAVKTNTRTMMPVTCHLRAAIYYENLYIKKYATQDDTLLSPEMLKCCPGDCYGDILGDEK